MSIDRPVEDNEEPVLPSEEKRTVVPPSAWKPGVTWDGEEGEVVSTPSPERPEATPTHLNEVLQEWGYNPEEYEIVEPLKVSTWDTQTKEGDVQKLYSYRAGVRLRSSAKSIPFDDLIKEVKRHRPLRENIPEGDSTFVVCLADWQIGKGDGDGLVGTMRRIEGMILDVEQRIRDLRKLGRKLGTLAVIGLGDMIEGCDGNYASQTFTTQANRREQVRICRRYIRDAICRWAKHFKRVIVSAVPGNHGENRKDGKSFTEDGDNDDVAVFEVVAEILAANPEAYGHVEFRLPENEMSVAFDLDGIIVGFNHGHLSGGSASPQIKQKKWWEDQAFGEMPIGQAKILVTGHYHHASINQYGKKCHMQCPAMDGGSKWWEDIKGSKSPPGTLTFTVGENVGRAGWNDYYIV